MKYRIITVFFLFALAISLIAADGWQEKDAVFRISTPVRQNTEARFFIPNPQSGGDFQCAVFNADGAAGSATAIVLDKATVGFRVVIPPAKANGKTALIYFAPAKDVPKEAPEDERPFKVIRNVRTVTTRAFTAKEIMGYFGELQKPAQISYVKNAGELPASEQWQLPEKTHIAALLQWETLFVLNKDEELSFGSKQANIAWTMLVDGEAVGDWHASEPEKDGSFCKAVAVGKGVHTFQMLVIQRFGDTLPQALIKNADGVRQLMGVSAPDFPSRVTVEFSEKDKPASKANHEWPQAYGSITTAKGEGMGNAVAFAKATSENAEFTDLEGRAIAIADSMLIWNAKFTPGVRVGMLHFPARRRFTPAKQVFIRPRITNAPNVLPFGKELELAVAIDAPQAAEMLLKFADISISYSDKDGVIDAADAVEPLNGRQQFTLKARSMESFEGGRFPTSIAVNFSFFTERFPISSPAEVRFVHPGDDEAFAKLSASGIRLYHGDVPATLVCSRLPMPPIASTVKLSSTGRNGFKVMLIDSFTECLFAPNAKLSLRSELAKHLPDGVECDNVTVCAWPGTSTNLSMLVEFCKSVAYKPDIFVILNGASATKGFETPLDATAASLFMAQSCLAKGILPVLTTMPLLPGVDSATARLEALYIKEMATALGVPVIDFYSMNVMGTTNARSWYLSVNAMTATPNDRAREWLVTQLAKELMQIINQTK